MQISVKSNVNKAFRNMSRLHRKQMPFAVALGLTMTPKKVAKVEKGYYGKANGAAHTFYRQG